MPATSTLHRTAFVLLILVCSAPLFGDSAPQLDRFRQVASMNDAEALGQFLPGEIKEYRTAFTSILERQRDIIARLGVDPRVLASVDEKMAALARVSDADMARFMTLGLELSPLSEAVARVEAAVTDVKEIAREKEAMSSGGFPGFAVADYSFCGSSRIDGGGMLAARAVWSIVQGIWYAADRACNQVLVVAGEGGNVSLFCIPSDIVMMLAEEVFDAFMFCLHDINGAEIRAIYERSGHMHTDLENAESSILTNDNSNKDAIVINSNSNKQEILDELSAVQQSSGSSSTAIIQNDNSNRSLIINHDDSNRELIIENSNANRDLIVADLRMLTCDLIRLLNTQEGKRSSEVSSCQGQPGFPYAFPEKDKTGQGMSAPAITFTPVFRDEPSRSITMETHLLEGRMIPGYYLPASRGGSIEAVKRLVWSTISAQTELNIAPEQTGPASLHAAQADEMLAAGQYVAAYRSYARAYQQLVPTD